MENLSQRKCLDILLVVLLSVIAISQVYESCIKFVKRQTTQSVSLQDTDIVFPSMTICDKNGFKSIDVMETANMSNFRLMTKVNIKSDIQNTKYGTPPFANLKHHETFLLVVTVISAGVCQKLECQKVMF